MYNGSSIRIVNEKILFLPPWYPLDPFVPAELSAREQLAVRLPHRTLGLDEIAIRAEAVLDPRLFRLVEAVEARV